MYANALNRRFFLSGKSKKDKAQVLVGLEPYTAALTQREVYHLLRRTGFGVSYEVAQKLIGKTAHQAVELLLDNALAPVSIAAPTWINDGYDNTYIPDGEARNKAIRQYLDLIVAQNLNLKHWWLQVINTDNQSIREKMTLFWHGHFVSQYIGTDFIPAQYMYRQNKLFRDLHQGSFRTFLERISLDGAMLLYLNGQSSSADAPNENYARELLELFTMGIGPYDEFDIREIAKLLTGWRTNHFNGDNVHGLYNTYLAVGSHNFDTKVFFYEIHDAKFAQTQENVYNLELKMLIDRILVVKGKFVAEFMAKKIFSFFVYSNSQQAEPSIINAMAAVFIENKFEIRPLIAALLKSKYFYEESNIGVQIKTPADIVLGFSKHFPMDTKVIESIMTEMGQELLNPPNVAGWKGYRNWISSKSLPFIVSMLSNAINNQSNEAIAIWAMKFPTYNTSAALTKTLLELFYPKVSSDDIIKFEQKLLGGAPAYEWSEIIKNNTTAGLKLKGLIKEIIKAPAYFLC